MKFGYIVNQDRKLIEVSRIQQPRYELILKMTELIPRYLFPIEINITRDQIIHEIDLLLTKRETQPLDIPNYKGRFLEEEVFENKNYKGVILKLCNTGFDSHIVFLINILESLENGNTKLYMFFAKDHKELREFIENGII